MSVLPRTVDPVGITYDWLDDCETLAAQSRPAQPYEAFNPSSVSQCSRRLWYRGVGAQPDPVNGAGWLSQYGPWGDWAHDHVRFLLRDAGCELGGLEFNDVLKTVTELDVFDTWTEHNGQPLNLKGRGDGRIKIDDEWCYLELKSVDAYKYKWMQTAHEAGRLYEYIADKYATYIDQSNMMMSPEMLDLKRTYLIIINRSNCQFGFSDADYTNRVGGLMFDFDPARWERQKTKMAMVRRKVGEGVPPLQEYAEGSKACGQCPYAGRCWNVAD